MSTQAPDLKQEEFDKFRDFFYKKTGIHFEDNKRYFVDKRLLQRVSETGNKTFREYFTFMRFQASQEEFQQLVNAMTVNETYFFREEYQMKCLVGPVLADIVGRNRGQGPIRIWSIPCATGEEPYSIAIHLLEYWPAIASVDVELIGSDIDTQVLAQAKAGQFSSRSVQNLPPELLKKYFRAQPDGRFRISSEIKDCVDFRQVNLADRTTTMGFRNLDVIFCRNLLIYFDDASRREAVEMFFDALRPGGFIFLGHSETMSRISSLFKVRKFSDAIAYQKPLT